jgi:hypothetical protein
MPFKAVFLCNVLLYSRSSFYGVLFFVLLSPLFSVLFFVLFFVVIAVLLSAFRDGCFEKRFLGSSQ